MSLHCSLRRVVATLGALIAAAACTTHAPSSSSAARPPNILLIVADDLGYSDLGAFGGEISTPNIDSLAASGRMFSNFHVGAVCSPTRAMLLSGADHHRVGLGNMAEVTGMNITQNQPINAPWGAAHTYGFGNVPVGYSGHLIAGALSMPELLRDAGYRTVMAGKWHLAYDVAAPDTTVKTWYRIKPDALPNARGFDKSFVLINGGAAHFAPSTPPTPLDLVTYAEDDKLLPAQRLPRDFYSTAAFTDKLIAYIDGARADDKPFFAYAAYTAPHWPLQAPEADIAAQKGRYDAGYDAIAQRRFERMKQLGIVPATMKPNPGVAGPGEGGKGPKRWAELNAQERAHEARAMEVYAAMVANLDAHVGRLIAHLKATGEYERTLIVFMSDNGAEGAPPYAPPVPGTKVDNGLDNIGRPGSVVAYGPRWAEVSSTPLRLFKGFTGAEGATASPLIVKLPGQTAPRPTSDARIQVADLLPTVLAAAAVQDPGAQYRGRAVQPSEGVSWWAAWSAPGAVPLARADDAVLADELLGTGYVVKGRWKLSRQPTLSPTPTWRKDVPWQLFDLRSDRGETTDVAAQHPQLVAELQAEWSRYVQRAGVIEQAQAYSGR
jgi:arylsulfatase A-like enzyme